MRQVKPDIKDGVSTPETYEETYAAYLFPKYAVGLHIYGTVAQNAACVCP